MSKNPLYFAPIFSELTNKNNTMGPKRDRAGEFEMDLAAFELPREAAISWLNTVLDVAFDDVEQVAMRGAEWCQLVHLCTTPEEGIIDLSRVHFGRNHCGPLTRDEVDENYAVLTDAFANLNVNCEYLTGNAGTTLANLKQGYYSQAIDLLHFMKHFTAHMGEPLYYHPKHERDEVEAARAATRVVSKEDTKPRRRGAAAAAAPRSAVATPRGGTGLSRRREPVVATPRAEKRTLATLNRNVPTAAQGSAAKRRAVAVPGTTAPQVDAKLAAGKLQHTEALLKTLAMNIDGAVSAVDSYLAASPDVPTGVREAVKHILSDSLSEP